MPEPATDTTAQFLAHLNAHHPRFVWPMERFITDQAFTAQELARMTPAALSMARGIGPNALNAYAKTFRALDIPTCEEWSGYGQ